MAPRCEQTQLAWPSLQGHHGGQSRAGHFRIRCTRWRSFPRGKWITEATCRKWECRGRGRKQPGWKEAVDMGGGQLLSHGRLCNGQSSSASLPRAAGSHGPAVLSAPTAGRKYFPPRPSMLHQQSPFPLGLGLYLKLTRSSEKMRQRRGRKNPNTQQRPTLNDRP